MKQLYQKLYRDLHNERLRLKASITSPAIREPVASATATLVKGHKSMLSPVTETDVTLRALSEDEQLDFKSPKFKEDTKQSTPMSP